VTRHRTEGEAPSGKPELRTVDPYSLINFQNIWYLGAYCHVRRDVRTFRLDRMDDLDLLDATFARPPGFRMRGRDHTTSGSVTVRALFAPEAARWVRESRSFFAVAEEETPDGLVVTFAVREERELLQWLLGWGQRVRVLEPESLRRLLAAEADTMLRQHTSTPTSPNSSAP
jgi:predicted DNA-binding transcriptional regulator YafY